MVSSSISKMSDSKKIADILVTFWAFLSFMSIFITLLWHPAMKIYGAQKNFVSVLSLELGILVICVLAVHGLEKNRRVHFTPFLIFIFVQFACALIHTSSLLSEVLISAAVDYDSIKWYKFYHFDFFAAKSFTLMHFYFIKVCSSLYLEMGRQVS